MEGFFKLLGAIALVVVAVFLVQRAATGQRIIPRRKVVPIIEDASDGNQDSDA